MDLLDSPTSAYADTLSQVLNPPPDLNNTRTSQVNSNSHSNTNNHNMTNGSHTNNHVNQTSSSSASGTGGGQSATSSSSSGQTGSGGGSGGGSGPTVTPVISLFKLKNFLYQPKFKPFPEGTKKFFFAILSWKTWSNMRMMMLMPLYTTFFALPLMPTFSKKREGGKNQFLLFSLHSFSSPLLTENCSTECTLTLLTSWSSYILSDLTLQAKTI